MATNSEKVQKQPGEAFAKLRSDHEQFLEAYEKPTQIYRFLKARHAVKPLFLHRNLSYMQHRSLRRKKTRSRKLKVNDLISFAQEPTTNHDLAKEIKSDNHLRISFSGLENGIDLESMLDNGESSNQQGPTGSHESQVMEVEVLLYQFKQPSAEALMANPSSYPCDCKHLGKLSLTYTPSGATEEGGSHQSTGEHTLMIPESEITWKGSNRMAGTHVLVFKASHCDKPAEKKAHTKKAYRKNLSSVSIELNRLNHNEIATQIAKAKQQSQFQSQATEKTSSQSVSSGDTGKHLNSVKASEMQSSSVASSKCSATRTKSDGSDQTLSTVASVAANSSCTVGQRRVKSKVKREKRDACVMTDITLGTAPIDDLPQTPKIPSVDARPKGKHPSKKASPQSSKSCGLSSPPSTPKEANDKSTSPLILKLSFKNGTGSINGMVLPNGYATAEEMETQEKKSKALASSVGARNEELQHPESLSDDNATTHSINPETGEAISTAEPLPPGSSGEHPLVVSIPRSYYNLSRSSSTSSLASESSLSYRRGPRLPRRSEIQLLLDGDKPPDRRISAQEIPVFIAEDVSNRTTRSSASQSRGPWHTLGSSTRRITPVEHFVYPLPTLAPKKTSTGNPRKRSLSDSDQPSASSPPPAKQPRTEMEVIDKQPNTPKTPPDEEEMRDLELRPQPRCLIQTDDVFCAELAMFDSRGYCLLEDGDYTLLMQKCSKKDEDSGTILTFVPLTWNTVFGNGKKIEEECDLRSLCLKFSVQWTHGPPKNTVNIAFQTALDLKRLREEYCLPRTPSPPPPPPLPLSSLLPMTMEEPASESTSNDLEDQEDGADSSDPGLVVPHSRKQRIIFNFLYNNNALQQTESQAELRCPWCYLRCGRLYSLLKHMSLSHPRFLFTYSPTEGCPVIDVHVNKLYEAGFSDPDPGERNNLSIVQKRRGPSRCLSSTAVLVERHEKAEEDLSEFLNDGTWKRGYNTNRIYYHSCSILPMLGEEIEVDSEQENETFRWQSICSQKMIEEFTDVNRGEKELMKLWNVFAMENKLIADKQIPLACVKFAKEKRKVLLEKGLVRNFMTHLINLCDYGLINAGIIRKGMSVIYDTSS